MPAPGRAPHRLPAAPPSTAPPALVRLPIHDELYLLAHDTDTGAPRIHTGSLGIGLAGAVLIHLLLEQRVNLWNEWIHVEAEPPPGDTIAAAALASIRSSPTLPQVASWLRGFGEAELYDRIRANLLAVGILRRQTRRLRADMYPAVHHAWQVRVGARLRSVLYGHEQPDSQCAALCGLVDALGIYNQMGMSEPAAKTRHGLRLIASTHLPPVRYVTSCVANVVGEAATAVYG